MWHYCWIFNYDLFAFVRRIPDWWTWHKLPRWTKEKIKIMRPQRTWVRNEFINTESKKAMWASAVFFKLLYFIQLDLRPSLSLSLQPCQCAIKSMYERQNIKKTECDNFLGTRKGWMHCPPHCLLWHICSGLHDEVAFSQLVLHLIPVLPWNCFSSTVQTILSGRRAHLFSAILVSQQ